MVLIERATRARRMAQAQAVTIVLTFFAMLPNEIFIGHGRNIILRFGESICLPFQMLQKSSQSSGDGFLPQKA